MLNKPKVSPASIADLYNIARDPDELDSVAGQPRYAAKQRALEAALGRLRDCRGQGCDVSVRPASP